MVVGMVEVVVTWFRIDWWRSLRMWIHHHQPQEQEQEQEQEEEEEE